MNSSRSKLLQYYVNEKGQEFNQAVRLGFSPDFVVYSYRKQFYPGFIHLLGGLQFGNFEIFKQILRAGDSYIQCDRGYIQGLKGVKGYIRITKNAYQKYWVEERPMNRLIELCKQGLSISPWRQHGSHILVVPPSSLETNELYGGDNWLERTKQQLREITDRPLMISHKGDHRSLKFRFTNCHAVVTCTSNVAVDAVIAGIPVFTHHENPAFPMSTKAITQIENPRTPNRIKWLASLAYGQFTLHEIRTGFARSIILGDS